MTDTITRDAPNPMYNPSQRESRTNPKTVPLEFSNAHSVGYVLHDMEAAE